MEVMEAVVAATVHPATVTLPHGVVRISFVQQYIVNVRVLVHYSVLYSDPSQLVDWLLECDVHIILTYI